MSKHIAIITVVYNNYTILQDFFTSLQKQTNTDFRLFLADASQYKEKIITDQLNCSMLPIDNKGYAFGVNQGIKEAIQNGFDTFCVINSDVILDSRCIESINGALTKHPNSLIGGKILYAPGYEYHKDRYQEKDLGNIIWYAGGKNDWKNATVSHIGVDEVDNGQFDEKTQTEFITGCLICFDKKVLDKVGFWDEKYFLYYEDADFCERVKRKNIELWYIPSIKIWHKNAQSTEGSGSQIHQKYQKKAQLHFAFKYAPLRTKLYILRNFFLGR